MLFRANSNTVQSFTLTHVVEYANCQHVCIDAKKRGKSTHLFLVSFSVTFQFVLYVILTSRDSLVIELLNILFCSFFAAVMLLWQDRSILIKLYMAWALKRFRLSRKWWYVCRCIEIIVAFGYHCYGCFIKLSASICMKNIQNQNHVLYIFRFT